VVLRLGKSIAAEGVLRSLAQANQTVAAASSRLASGQRITSAGDDAAGLAVSQALSARRRIGLQAVRNVNDGISYLSVAQSTISALSQIVTRQQELATQAASGAYSSKQLEALDTEARSLTAEYNRVVAAATYNGVSVLVNHEVAIQSGIGDVETTQVGVGTLLENSGSGSSGVVGTGTFVANATYLEGPEGKAVQTADLNNDGHADVVAISKVGFTNTFLLGYVSDGAGNLSLASSVDDGIAGSGYLALGDFDNDGNTDAAYSILGGGTAVKYGVGDGTFTAAVTVALNSEHGLTAGDFNGDGRDDLAGVTYGTPGSVSILLAAGGRTFSGGTTSMLDFGTTTVESGDVDGDGNLDLVTGTIWVGAPIHVLYGTGAGTFSVVQSIAATTATTPHLADLDGDGMAEIVTVQGGSLGVYTHSGPRSFNAESTIVTGAVTGIDFGDVNGDGALDVVTAEGTVQTRLGNGDGTFQSAAVAESTLTMNTIALLDLNGDGVLDFGGSTTASLPGILGTALATTTSGGSSGSGSPFIDDIDLTSASTARSALEDRRALLEGLLVAQGSLGAQQSRLEHVVARLHSTNLAYAEAVSRIVDVDVASEVASLIAAQVREQIASALLSSLRLDGQLVLKLLTDHEAARDLV
jgi:flagellin